MEPWAVKSSGVYSKRFFHQKAKIDNEIIQDETE